MDRPSAPGGPVGGEVDRIVLDAVEQLVTTLRSGSEAGSRSDRASGPTVVASGTDLEADLGLDSLSVAELVVMIESATGRRLAEGTLARARTAGDLIRAAGGEPTGDERAPARAAAAEPSSTVPPPRGATAFGLYARAVFAALAVVGWVSVAVVPGSQRRWRIVRLLGRVLFAATGTRLRIHGRDRLPTGRYVVVANHPSFLDPLVVALTVPAPLTFTATEGLAAVPMVRSFLRRLRVVLVPSSTQRVRAVSAADRLTGLAEHRRLVFFPEGRRSTAVGLERFRMGAFVVAARTGVPIVPVTIRGTRTILPVGARWPRRRDVEVSIGHPVRPAGTDFPAAVAAHHEIRAQILAACEEPDLGDVVR